MALPSTGKVSVEPHTFLLDESKEITRSSWKQVYSACLGKVVSAQATYHRHIGGGKKVEPSFFDGKLFFDSKNYPAQVLATISKDRTDWTWGYEKPVAAPDSCFELAREIKGFGTSWNLPPLKQGVQKLGKGLSGEQLAVVACGLSKGFYCYTKVEEKDYDIYVAFNKLPPEVFRPINAEMFFALAARCFPMFNVEHRVFVESLLQWNGTPYEWKVKKIVAHLDEDVEMTFQEEEGVPSVFAMKIV